MKEIWVYIKGQVVKLMVAKGKQTKLVVKSNPISIFLIANILIFTILLVYHDEHLMEM